VPTPEERVLTPRTRRAARWGRPARAPSPTRFAVCRSCRPTKPIVMRASWPRGPSGPGALPRRGHSSRRSVATAAAGRLSRRPGGPLPAALVRGARVGGWANEVNANHDRCDAYATRPNGMLGSSDQRSGAHVETAAAMTRSSARADRWNASRATGSSRWSEVGRTYFAQRPASSSSTSAKGSTRTLASSCQVPSTTHRSSSSPKASSVLAMGSTSHACETRSRA
jgi:hypothetical protein